jgi:hypothetical protein
VDWKGSGRFWVGNKMLQCVKCTSFLDMLTYYQFHKADCAPWIYFIYFCVHMIRGIGTLTFKPSWGNVPFIFSN